MRPTNAMLGLVAVVGGLSCDGVLSVQGRVIDQAGRPISGARVSAYYVAPETSATTDAQGCFRIFKVTAPFTHQVPFLVEAPGYRTFLGQITCPKDDRLTAHLASLDTQEYSALKKGTVDQLCQGSRAGRP